MIHRNISNASSEITMNTLAPHGGQNEQRRVQHDCMSDVMGTGWQHQLCRGGIGDVYVVRRHARGHMLL